MDARLERKPRTRYLGIGRMFPHETAPARYMSLVDELAASGVLDRLRHAAGSREVVALFCYRCDPTTGLVSYHAACETVHPANPNPGLWEELELEPALYGVFSGKATGQETMLEASDRVVSGIWDIWLPSSGYTALIDPRSNCCVEGFASIEIYCTGGDFEIWMPLTDKPPSS